MRTTNAEAGTLYDTESARVCRHDDTVHEHPLKRRTGKGWKTLHWRPCPLGPDAACAPVLLAQKTKEAAMPAKKRTPRYHVQRHLYGRRKYTNRQVAEMLEMLASGRSRADAAKKTGINLSSQGAILRGECYRDIPWPAGLVDRLPQLLPTTRSLNAAREHATTRRRPAAEPATHGVRVEVVEVEKQPMGAVIALSGALFLAVTCIIWLALR